jgi:hypothetical protein
MGSLFDHRSRLHPYRPSNSADLSRDRGGCRLHPAVGRDCEQQERLNSVHVESDTRGTERDEPTASYHDNVDLDDHDNSYDYHYTDDKYDLHKHVNNKYDYADDDNYNDNVLRLYSRSGSPAGTSAEPRPRLLRLPDGV